MTGLASVANRLIEVAVSTGELHAWWAVTGAWINAWFWYPLFVAATVFTLLLFPSGLPSPRWRPVAWVAAVVTAALTVWSCFAPVLEFGDSSDSPTIQNPLASWVPGPVSDAFSGSEGIGGVILLITMGFAVAAPVMRYRRGTVIEREQLRWFAFAAVLLIMYAAASQLVIPDGGGWLNDFALAVILTFFPISCAMAILRYRLFEIDRIISRTVSYVVVTGLVLAVYAGVITATTRLFPDSSSLAVAAATLIAAALARPLLRRVRERVDRRFDRTRYDQLATVEAFGNDVRNLVDPADLQSRLLSTVGAALQPAKVALWADVRR
jgi:hypothetical protein